MFLTPIPWLEQITLHQLKDKEATKKMLDDTEKLLDDVDGVTPVHGR